VLSAEYIHMGFDYVALATDIGLLRNGAQAVLKQATLRN
jgi:4-hydroxy-2-oxoheptanedioate aldolase